MDRSTCRLTLPCVSLSAGLFRVKDGQLNFTLYFSMHFNVDVQVHVQPDCRRTTVVRVMLRCHRLVWPSGNLASLSISSSWSLGKLSVAAETPGSRKARVLLS